MGFQTEKFCTFLSPHLIMCQAFTLYPVAKKIKARFVKTSILLTLVAAIGCSVFAARGGFETHTAKHPKTLQVTQNGEPLTR